MLNFKDYFKVSYNTDAQGDIYPDVDKLMNEIPEGEEKKKKPGAPKKGGMPAKGEIPDEMFEPAPEKGKKL